MKRDTIWTTRSWLKHSEMSCLGCWMLLITIFSGTAPALGDWAAVSYVTARAGHTATLLPSGRVLVVGGTSGGGPLQSADIYDPLTGEAEATSPLSLPRADHTATLLRSGQVLVVGGNTGGGSLDAELYDPATGSWQRLISSTGIKARKHHTATLLPTGEVLIAGGSPISNENRLRSVVLFDLQNESFSENAKLGTARKEHTATLLDSGNVLIIGGRSSTETPLAELYDREVVPPTWVDVPLPDCDNSPCDPPVPDPSDRSGHTATLLGTGKVLVVGGSDHSALLYDSAEGWQITGSLAHSYLPDEAPEDGQRRSRHSGTLLPSGKVLVVSGKGPGPDNSITFSPRELERAEIYDPTTESWHLAGMLTPRQNHTVTLLPSGQVLVIGGYQLRSANGVERYDFISAVELYNPDRGSWAQVHHLSKPRARHTATLLPSGEVLVAGGQSGLIELPGSFPKTAERYDGQDDWLDAGSLSAGRINHTATLLASDFSSGHQVLLVGGRGRFNTAVSFIDIYDVDSNSWQQLDPDPGPPPTEFHTTTLLLSNKLLVAGGANSSGESLAGCELLAETEQGWAIEQEESPPDLRTPRRRHTATRLPSGKVLVVGGFDGDTPLATSELYDPLSNTWQDAGLLLYPRGDHTATLLPSGRVMITGGGTEDGMTKWRSSEIYSPDTNAWTAAGDLKTFHSEHTATLLANGTVLVIGGAEESSGYEVYAPSTQTWELFDPPPPICDSAPPNTACFDPATLEFHTATLLQSGEVLITGGGSNAGIVFNYSKIAVLYEPRELRSSYKPTINPTGTSESLNYGTTFKIEGNFRADSEAGDGTASSSAVNYPLFQIRTLDGFHFPMLVPIPTPPSNVWDEPTSLEIQDLPPGIPPGPLLLTAFVAGVPSEPSLISATCSLHISPVHPMDKENVTRNTSAVFTVDTLGGLSQQWQICVGSPDELCSEDGDGWIDIPGATETTYTTPPVTASQSGTRYRALIDGGCIRKPSKSAVLTVLDTAAPTTQVLSPSGGEYWLLSEEGETPNTELITWSMTDDIRICQVSVFLLVSSDGGETFNPASTAEGSGLPATFGSGGVCFSPGENTTSTTFEVPTDFSTLGGAGSLNKIRVEVTDHVGNTAVAESPRPFFIVKPNDDSVKTLILWHEGRMSSAFDDLGGLETKLNELADHPLVQGRVIDLNDVTGLGPLYGAWDADPGNVTKANAVLFGDGGIQEYLLDLLESTFTGVEYLVLVGDDRMIPLARLEDRAEILSEEDYTETGLDLTADGTTVGRALAADLYLSDDPLAVLDRVGFENGSVDIPASGTCRNDVRPLLAYIPDLSVGRLVEEPSEIITTIAGFISQGGLLDLSSLDPADARVLVTGYDFLSDSANRITQRWQRLLGDPAVGADLQGPGWDETDLLDGLCGDGGSPYPIGSLNGHANHYEEGVPGEDPLDIRGLSAEDLVADNACGPDTPLDLTGGVFYAVGCHGGLPVAAENSDEDDHAFDLPQAFMRQGAMAYVANTGFGWGLELGPPGYGERMVVLMTEELTSGGDATLSVGQAIQRVKQRYFLEDSGCFDAFDQKSLMQWSLFGLPMYGVRIGSSEDAADLAEAQPLAFEDLPTEERFDQVTVRRQQARTNENVAPLPPYLTRVEHRFDFSAEGVYVKRKSDGEPETVPGCPDEDGCYYELNGLATGQADLPVEPYFVYESRLLGTSQHGVLWKGGTFLEENDWKPLRAVLQSNNSEEFEDLGPIGRHFIGCPIGTSLIPGEDSTDGCPATDLELNKLIVPTGELVRDDAGELSIHRRQETVDLEVFYFNDAQDSSNNCDRIGPDLGAGPFEPEPDTFVYHQVDGTLVQWRVSPPSPDEVWRVLVVLNDGTLDADGRGSWQPVELEDDGSGSWTGSFEAGPGATLSYTLQVVDNRGNVSWLPFVPSPDDAEPSSGIPTAMPGVVEVTTADPEADLEISQSVSVNPVLAGNLLIHTVTVSNHGPSRAENVSITNILSNGVTFVLSSGCAEDPNGVPSCTFGTVEAGASRSFDLAVRVGADVAPGTLLDNSAVVSSSTLDPESLNDSSLISTLVETAADLSITMVNAPDPVNAGETLRYTLMVSNNGPSDARDVELSGLLPPGVSFASSSDCVETSPGEITCALGAIAERFSGSFSYDVLIDSGSTGSIVQTMAISAPTTEHQPGDETATTVTTVKVEADLSITKLDSMDPVTTETFMYTLEVSNPGPSDATDVVVTDVLPDGLVFEASDDCTFAGGIVTCDLGTLVAGQTIANDFTVMLDASFPPWIDNTAVVAGSGTDPNADDNSDTERTVLDITSPQVLSIELQDGQELVDCQTVTSELRQISVRFSEDLYDPVGDDDPDDVTHAHNYLLVAAGPDRTLDTDRCGGALGDDTAITVDGVVYDRDTWTAIVAFNSGEPLPDELYRLLVCGSTSIVDLVENPLDGDGDGTGGDDFERFFRVDQGNLLRNGHFDCGLSQWAPNSTNPDEIIFHGDDFESSADSGSVQLTNLTESSVFELDQCFEIFSRAELQMSSRVRLELMSGPQSAMQYVWRCELYSALGCDPQAHLESTEHTIVLPDSNDLWTLQEAVLQAPAGARSARCDFGLHGAADFVAGVDALFVGGDPGVFADGFESGDVSLWSSSSP